jgi:hypothetical protein
MLAILALNLDRDAPEMQLCANSNRAIADHIPIKLDGIVNGGRPLPHDNKQVGNTLCMLGFGMAHGDFENTLRNSEFVHGFFLCAMVFKSKKKSE